LVGRELWTIQKGQIQRRQAQPSKGGERRKAEDDEKRKKPRKAANRMEPQKFQKVAGGNQSLKEFEDGLQKNKAMTGEGNNPKRKRVMGGSRGEQLWE